MSLQILTSRDARSQGASPRGLESGVRSGRLLRLRAGAYVRADEYDAATAAERHRAQMDAVVATASRPPVFSHESAALVHGIPVVGAWPEVPHLVDSELGRASRRSPRGVVVHRPRYRPEVTLADGVLATSPVATALALAASRSALAGTVALDHVLFRGASRAEMEQTIADWQPFHGAGRATRALDAATGCSETALETLSLCGIRGARLPEPEQQAVIAIRGRRYRVDFLWRELGVVGEADGRLKYLTGTDLLDEKDREDDIRSLDLRFARWDWDDAWAVTPMLAKLARVGVVPVGSRVAPRFATYSA